MIRYMSEHWQGEHSLARSFWLNSLTGLLICGTVVALTTDYARRGSIEDGDTLLQTLVMVWIGMLIILTWEAVGCWRAATEHMAQTGRIASPLLVKGLVSVVALVIGVEIADAVAALGEIVVMTRMAREASVPVPGSQPERQVSLLPPDQPTRPRQNIYRPDGSDSVVAANHPAFSRVSREEIKMSGQILVGMEMAFSKILYSDPAVSIIRLESPGGSVGVAMDMLSSIMNLRHNTEVLSHCLSACTLIFAGGDMRIASPNARFGFHKFSASTASKKQIEDAENQIREYLIRARWLRRDFMEHAFQVPSSKMWYPSMREMVEANYVTHILDDGRPVAADTYCRFHRC
ncbi:membrane hypothetical protein [uncultured Gammaproteobacteria bacterium]